MGGGYPCCCGCEYCDGGTWSGQDKQLIVSGSLDDQDCSNCANLKGTFDLTVDADNDCRWLSDPFSHTTDCGNETLTWVVVLGEPTTVAYVVYLSDGTTEYFWGNVLTLDSDTTDCNATVSDSVLGSANRGWSGQTSACEIPLLESLTLQVQDKMTLALNRWVCGSCRAICIGRKCICGGEKAGGLPWTDDAMRCRHREPTTREWDCGCGAGRFPLFRCSLLAEDVLIARRGGRKPWRGTDCTTCIYGAQTADPE